MKREGFAFSSKFPAQNIGSFVIVAFLQNFGEMTALQKQGTVAEVVCISADAPEREGRGKKSAGQKSTNPWSALLLH